MRIRPAGVLIIAWLSTSLWDGDPVVNEVHVSPKLNTRWAQAEPTQAKLPSTPMAPAPSAPEAEGTKLSSDSAVPVRPRGAPVDPNNVGGAREPRPNRSPNRP